jgi:hypothetical protein
VQRFSQKVTTNKELGSLLASIKCGTILAGAGVTAPTLAFSTALLTANPAIARLGCKLTRDNFTPLRHYGHQRPRLRASLEHRRKYAKPAIGEDIPGSPQIDL